MIRFGNRRSTAIRAGLAVAAIASASALAGCSAGQVSQVATQAPAINGTTGSVGENPQISLRNVHLEAVETGDALKPGSTVALMLTAVNDSAEHSDKLVSITSDVGDVTVAGLPLTIKPGESLFIGDPAGATALGAIENVQKAEAEVKLTQPIRNGLNYNVTFTFAEAGPITLAVPISAGSEAQRQPGDELHGDGSH